MHVPLMKDMPSTENAQQCGSGLARAVREQTLSICPLGIHHAERTFYNLLEFSTAYRKAHWQVDIAGLGIKGSVAKIEALVREPYADRLPPVEEPDKERGV